jgi:hypothetical protein
MVEGPTIDKHHLVPVCHGGVETTYLHRICHNKIHHTFTEKELEKTYNTVDALLSNEDIQKFVSWVKKKDIEFVDQSEDTSRRRNKRWR